ncbi:hypothetical protein [Actinacidiphila alni]|uniref:hypothetical protein n=1 Tax=Actinacidiphila alni TaxID=380248 RepID=UPI0015A5CA2C
MQNANQRIQSIQSQVEEAKSRLATAYQGADGQAYAQVMNTWLEEVDRIKMTCEAMQNQLGNSMQANNNVQSNNYQAVADQFKLTSFGSSVENGAYSAMMS